MLLLHLVLCLTLVSSLCSFAFIGMKRIAKVSVIRSSNAAESHTVLYDTLPVDFGVLKISGDDRLKFLHGLTTNSFLEGTQSSSVKAITADFLNAKGKLVDHNVFILNDSDVFILCEPESTKRLFKYMDNFIFPADKVSITDVTTSYTTAYTTHQEQAAVSIPINDIHSLSSSSSTAATIEGQLTNYVRNAYLTLFPASMDTSSVKISKSSLIFYQILRCVLGRPSFPYEIQPASTAKDSEGADKGTPSALLRQYDMKFTPFELGIADSSILLNKGCYTGQEIISRAVNSLSPPSDGGKAKGGALRQMMQSLEMVSSGVEGDEMLLLLLPGTVIVDADDEDVGYVTSSIAYILNNIVQPSTPPKPSKVSLKQLKQLILDQFKADNIAESNSKLYEMVMKDGVIEQLLRRVLVLTRVRFIDENKDGYSCSIRGYEGFDLVRKAAEQAFTLPYLDYRFDKLLLANTAQQRRVVQVKLQQIPSATAADADDGESEKEREKRRIAEKMEKQRQQVEALLAKRKKGSS